jgi:hypothetical protein
MGLRLWLGLSSISPSLVPGGSSSGAVGADQADDLAGAHAEAHVVDGSETAETDADAGNSNAAPRRSLITASECGSWSARSAG